MGSLKNYLLTLLERCSDEQFGQDAVEWAILTGRVKLTYNLRDDLTTIMGFPGLPDTGQYDAIVEAYQTTCREHGEALNDLYHASGLIEEILRVPGNKEVLPV